MRNERVSYTQYMAPHGRRVQRTMSVEGTVKLKANTVETMGGRFEAEVLSTDEVSLTVAYDDDDIAMEIVPNGPKVLEAFDRLVDSALEAIEALQGSGDE